MTSWLGLAWLGLAWLELVWLGLAWLGLVWLGLAWLGLDLTLAKVPAHGPGQCTGPQIVALFVNIFHLTFSSPICLYFIS